MAIREMTVTPAEAISVVIVILGSTWLIRAIAAGRLWLRYALGGGLLAILSACIMVK